MAEKVLLKTADGVATITLNRPEVMNALDTETVEKLTQVLTAVANDESVRAVIITAVGRGFCTGADVKEMKALFGQNAGMRRERIRKFHRIIDLITNMEKPVIAGVNGMAAGGGAHLAQACDIRIASDKAQFSEVFARRALVPDLGGTYFLPRLVGLGKAKELVFTTKAIDAYEAEKLGLVNRVVPSDKLESEVFAFARELAKGPTKTLGLAKLAINKAMESSLSEALEYIIYSQIICLQSEDHKEAVQAFLEKREPQFKGK